MNKGIYLLDLVEEKGRILCCGIYKLLEKKEDS